MTVVRTLRLSDEHAPVPQHNLEAEQAVLGAALYDNHVLEVAADLRPDHFHEPAHGRLFERILALVQTGRRAEPIAVFDALKTDPALIELGGVRYLAELVDHAPPASNAAHFADMVMDLAARRELLRIAEQMAHTARLSGEPAFAQIAAAERLLGKLAHTSGAPANWQSAGQVAAEAIAKGRQGRGVGGLSTGIADLDRTLGGLRAGQMVVLGGRPGMGKSTAGLQIAKAVARQGRGVAFFSMEMPAFDLGLRMACDVGHDPLAPRYLGRSAGATYFDAARGDLTDQQWAVLDQARAEIETWPIAFDVRPGLTVSEMQARAARRFREWERQGVQRGCVIVDHLTIARPDQDRRGNKVAEVGDISRGLAEMSKTLDVPVIVLAQLSREVEKRGENDRRPNLADLRWAGEIEQDARVVAFLYRPEYYLRQPEDPHDDQAHIEWQAKLSRVRNKLWWIVAKNNNGPTGEVETYCDIAASAIRDKLGGANG